jgi:AraC-like DNA-binding protein
MIASSCRRLDLRQRPASNATMIDLAIIKAIARRHADAGAPVIPRLQVYTRQRPSEVIAFVYDPVAVLVLQGAKRTLIGDRVLEYGAGQCVVVAAELAAMGQISEASPERPYLALKLSLDPAVIAALLLDMNGMHEPPMASGFAVGKADPDLLDAWHRLLGLLDRPAEIPVMAHQRERELMFRLLMSPQGAMLRQIAGANSRLSHIRRAVAWIREHYAERLSVEAMATVAGMSASVFHRRFKAVTGLSPLQYQKHIRLHEARRRMVADQVEAATVAFSVGYESASQFNREYKRLFGEPPRRDIETIQASPDRGSNRAEPRTWLWAKD